MNMNQVKFMKLAAGAENSTNFSHSNPEKMMSLWVPFTYEAVLSVLALLSDVRSHVLCESDRR